MVSVCLGLSEHFPSPASHPHPALSQFPISSWLMQTGVYNDMASGGNWEE